MIAENPGHSEWYIERFRTMAASGHDLGGEARFVDASAPRRARIPSPAPRGRAGARRGRRSPPPARWAEGASWLATADVRVVRVRGVAPRPRSGGGRRRRP
eukprot:gene25601-46677_t